MDNAASIMLMFNGVLLDTISTLHNPNIIHAGSGNFQANQTGLLTKVLYHLLLPKEGYHFHPDAMANLVSMVVVFDHHGIVMDTDVNNAIYMFNDDGTYIQFQQMKHNIYSMHFGKTAETEHCYFTTVKGMEMQYSVLDKKRVILVWYLQERLRFPSDIDLSNAINYNTLDSCQFNHRDIQITNKIYGPSVASVKERSTKQENEMKRSYIITDISKDILNAYGKIHLDIDIMFVNKCVYFTFILQHIGLIHCCVIALHVKKRVMSLM